jgi:hypothetical protein
MKSTVQKPPTHKRRTEDELRKALAIVERHKDVLHINSDDEHVTVLEDAVIELLATRQVLMKHLQELGQTYQSTNASIKNMWQ